MAGGLGTRMSRFTKEIPKALIPVSGQPFIRRQLHNLSSQGISQVIISTGYLGDQIEAEVSENCPKGMTVTCVSDGPVLLGTGGSLRRIFDLGLLDDVFLYTYGDSYLTVDHMTVAQSYDPAIAEALMTVCENSGGHEVGNAIVKNGMVTLYKKNLNDVRMKWIDYGLSVISSEALTTHIAANETSDIALMFESLSTENKLQAFFSSERYFEIGSMTGLEELESRLASPDYPLTR
jgi:MurNAc alpha-1-phosphate uridylyltransferase